MNSLNVRSILFFLLIIILAACISTSSEPEIVAVAPIEAQIPADPPAQFDVQTGAALYEASCAPCHGESGGGDGPSASAFSCEMPRFADGAPDQTLTDWYNTAFNGRRVSDTCLMPPWSGQLTPDQIWQAVAFAGLLRYDQSLAPAGETLLAEYQIGAADFLTDTFWQSGSTDADILAALQANTLPGFDFSAGLSQDDLQAALVAIRAAAYSPVTEVAQQSTPVPAATEEAQNPVSIVPPEQITLTGQVTNGTAGAAVPPDLTLTLRVVGLGSDGQPSEIYQAQASINANNQFSFTGIPFDPRAILSLETQHAGIRQAAPEIFAADISGESLTIDFTIYETTNDPGVISLVYVENLVDAVTVEGASLIFQTFEFSNNGDRIFVTDDGTSVEIPLPDGAVNASADAFAATPDRFSLADDGGRVRFIDTQPVFPGRVHRIDTRYNLVYNGQMQIEQSFPYALAEFAVFVPQHRGLEVESAQLVPIESGELNGITYLGFGGGGLPANTPLQFTVSDGASAAAVTGGNFLGDNSTVILGIGVLILIAGGMFMLYDLQKTRLTTQKPSARSRKELLAEVAALDEAYEKGRIDEDEYAEARAILKNQLRRFVK